MSMPKLRTNGETTTLTANPRAERRESERAARDGLNHRVLRERRGHRGWRSTCLTAIPPFPRRRNATVALQSQTQRSSPCRDHVPSTLGDLVVLCALCDHTCPFTRRRQENRERLADRKARYDRAPPRQSLSGEKQTIPACSMSGALESNTPPTHTHPLTTRGRRGHERAQSSGAEPFGGRP